MPRKLRQTGKSHQHDLLMYLTVNHVDKATQILSGMCCDFNRCYPCSVTIDTSNSVPNQDHGSLEGQPLEQG